MRRDKQRLFHIASDDEIRKGLTTDVYFLRTKEILEKEGLKNRRAYAEFTLGDLPEGWKWAVFCGLDEVINLLEGLDVDLYAVPEGTVFAPKDINGVRLPLMAIDGPYADYCIYETPALGLICQATGVATKSARVKKAAGEELVLAFGIRRMHPAIAPMLDRASYIGGCDGVSSLMGAETIGKPPKGTMPHALVVVFQGQKQAWQAFDRHMPQDVPRIALVDTYSDEKQEAILAVEALGEALEGVRLDTPMSRRGNLADIVREVRWELDIRGYRDVRIIVSGGLDEAKIPELKLAGASGFGVGTAISNAPTVDFAMDIVALEERPCAKKGKYSGRKDLLRCEKCLTFLVVPKGEAAPRCPTCNGKMGPILKCVLKKGKPTKSQYTPEEIRKRFLSQSKKIAL